MPDRRECPQCKRTRWIPLATDPYCAESCERAARRVERAAAVAAPLVRCCICGAAWPASSPDVEYRSLDRQWWCADETDCTSRAARIKAAMLAALDRVWDQLERDGWRI